MLGLVPLFELYSGKSSTMEQELANSHAVNDIARDKKGRVGLTTKKYSVNKPPFIPIWLFIAMENEVLKQVAYVNYSLNEFIELPIFWEI